MKGPVQAEAVRQSHKIAKEWYERANDQKQEEVIYKFICAFFALNALYNQVRSGDERKRLTIYARRKCEETGYNPFDEDISEYLDSAVTSELCNACPYSKQCRNNRTNTAKIKFKDLKNESDIEELFSAIYRVRCNLFHGSKDMNYIRNENLLKQGTIVINGLLKAIFTNDKFDYELNSMEAEPEPYCFKHK